MNNIQASESEQNRPLLSYSFYKMACSTQNKTSSSVFVLVFESLLIVLERDKLCHVVYAPTLVWFVLVSCRDYTKYAVFIMVDFVSSQLPYFCSIIYVIFILACSQSFKHNKVQFFGLSVPLSCSIFFLSFQTIPHFNYETPLPPFSLLSCNGFGTIWTAPEAIHDLSFTTLKVGGGD